MTGLIVGCDEFGSLGVADNLLTVEGPLWLSDTPSYILLGMSVARFTVGVVSAMQ